MFVLNCGTEIVPFPTKKLYFGTFISLSQSVTQKNLFISKTSHSYTYLGSFNCLYQTYSHAIMCPSCNGDLPATANGQTNGTNNQEQHTPHNPRRQPFASVGDYLSNVSNFKIIESTLREGEQVGKIRNFNSDLEY